MGGPTRCMTLSSSASPALRSKGDVDNVGLPGHVGPPAPLSLRLAPLWLLLWLGLTPIDGEANIVGDDVYMAVSLSHGGFIFVVLLLVWSFA
jgi:hypothetical protein